MKEIDARREQRSEKKLQENCEAIFRQRDILANRSRMDRRKTDMVGWPDFTFAVKGIACAVECKLERTILDKQQLEIARKLMANGWRFSIVRTEAELIEFLNRVEREG